MSIIDEILAILAPNDCLGCSAEGRLVCKECIIALPVVETKTLDSPYISSVISVTSYKGISKDLLWKLKSSGAQEAAKIMAECMTKLLPSEKNLIIVPIPTASNRVRQRGYDQAKLIARQISRKARHPYLNCLVRSGQAHQVGAGREQRLKQLENAFRVKNTELIKDSKIILVDDVVTTGASLELASKALKESGANEISAITFAQAHLRIKPESLTNRLDTFHN